MPQVGIASPDRSGEILYLRSRQQGRIPVFSQRQFHRGTKPNRSPSTVGHARKTCSES